MNHDEFAFFNQQLAAMLRDGIPLEGALKQLCANLRHGELRSEFERLENDLRSGRPLQEAVAARKLPEFYRQMVRVGVQGNDLPGVLLMLADYYQRVDSIWTRLKGLMVYPAVVLTAAFGLSCFLTVTATKVIHSDFSALMGTPIPPGIAANLWAPPVLTGLLLAILLIILSVPALRRALRWRLPAFKEAKLSQVAAAMGLLLKAGGNLGDSLGLVQQMEQGTAAGRELGEWRARLASGRGKFSEMAAPGRAFPPLFLWLVSNAGEDLAGGFKRAAEIYQTRAVYRTEMFLYAALPLSILALGGLLTSQVLPLAGTFARMLNGIGS